MRISNLRETGRDDSVIHIAFDLDGFITVQGTLHPNERDPASNRVTILNELDLRVAGYEVSEVLDELREAVKGLSTT